jgi:hypothetical protein
MHIVGHWSILIISWNFNKQFGCKIHISPFVCLGNLCYGWVMDLSFLPKCLFVEPIGLGSCVFLYAQIHCFVAYMHMASDFYGQSKCVNVSVYI